MSKEAKARIKINKLLEEVGWRLLDDKNERANVILENYTKITREYLNELGETVETTAKGYLDYLLLDSKGFPFIVLEAKKEDVHPLSAKGQSRDYATSQNCRFIILSNGNLHYLWDLKKGNPNPITTFPSPKTANAYTDHKPNPQSLTNEPVEDDYIVITQKHDYNKDPGYINESERQDYIEENKLRFLRKYQIRAVQTIQEEVANGKDRFLFEMATGTGKTLTSAAVIKNETICDPACGTAGFLISSYKYILKTTQQKSVKLPNQVNQRFRQFHPVICLPLMTVRRS